MRNGYECYMHINGNESYNHENIEQNFYATADIKSFKIHYIRHLVIQKTLQTGTTLSCRAPLRYPNGEATGPARESDLFMLPIPQMIHPGVESAENFEPQRSQTSCPMVERRLRVAAQN